MIRPTDLGSIEERATATLRATFRDENGVPVDPVTVTSVKISIRDLRSGTMIRTDFETIGAGGAVSLAGVYTFPLLSTDTLAIGTATVQRRLVTLAITFTTGFRPHACTFDVQNLTDVA